MSESVLEFVDIDFHRDVIPHPITTFYAKLKGDDLNEYGYHHNDLLVIDRSIPLHNNCFAIFCGRDSFRIKRVRIVSGKIFILPNKKDRWCPIEITESLMDTFWGVVKLVVKKVQIKPKPVRL